MNDIINPIELSKKLISCPSITPTDAGALDLLQHTLTDLGFECIHMRFSEGGGEPVENLYARFGKEGKNFCFAGHTDVVPPGDIEHWCIDPFEPEIIDDFLYGRGASDMKCAIACFVAAASEYIKANNGKINGSISLLITGDEEGEAINGTTQVLRNLQQSEEVIDACLVGEPTSSETLADMAKIGRRGSVTFDLTIMGKQGHVAYPQLADNPVSRLNKILHALDTNNLDDGTEYFDPSNLEIVSIDVGNTTENLIPAIARAKFNIRYNDQHKGATLVKWIEGICESLCEEGDAKFELKHRISGDAFLSEPGELSDVVIKAVKNVVNIEPKLSTTGGTSDARFIKDYCPVIELGMLNATAHKINECVSIDDIQLLKNIYRNVLEEYFA